MVDAPPPRPCWARRGMGGGLRPGTEGAAGGVPPATGFPTAEGSGMCSVRSGWCCPVLDCGLGLACLARHRRCSPVLGQALVQRGIVLRRSSNRPPAPTSCFCRSFSRARFRTRIPGSLVPPPAPRGDGQDAAHREIRSLRPVSARLARAAALAMDDRHHTGRSPADMGCMPPAAPFPPPCSRLWMEYAAAYSLFGWLCQGAGDRIGWREAVNGSRRGAESAEGCARGRRGGR